MTEENAKVAAQADRVANATIQKAEAMVKDKTNTSSQNRHVQAAKPALVAQQYAKANTKTIANAKKHNGDVWEKI